MIKNKLKTMAFNKTQLANNIFNLLIVKFF